MLRLARRYSAAFAALAVLTLLAACGGGGGPATVDHSYNADRLVIHDFIGTLAIETVPAGGEIGLHVDATRAQLDLLPISLSGNTLTIEWNGVPDRAPHWYEFWRGRWMFEMRDIDQYPTVTLTVPEDVDIDINGLIGRWTVGDRQGSLAFGAERGTGTIEATRTAQIGLSGDADVQIGPVAELLTAAISGSGSLTGNGAGRADLAMSGSGRMSIGDVAGSLTISIAGSGQVTVGDADSVVATVSGSGVARLGSVAAGLRASVQGSGVVTAASASGAFAANVSGSGSVSVDAGRGSPFEVTIAGSGSVRFAGIAVDPVVRVSGSGAVVLGAVEGRLDQATAGSGGVQVLH